MTKRTRLADYRTERGAAKYAAEIMRRFPSVTAFPIPSRSFGYAVMVKAPNGKSALAGKRPRNYGADDIQAAMQGNFRIPNLD